MVSKKNKGISIIVCCYNSEKVLPETFKHLLNQDIKDDLPCELIIVNNNSSDHTANVVESFSVELRKKFSFTFTNEKNQGLSQARMRGISIATREFILFCDDDNHLDSNYISMAYQIMIASPNIGILGGFGKASTETGKPFWFHKYENVYAIGKQGTHSGIVNGRKYLYGAGMILRKEIFDLLEKIQFQPLLTDRKGNRSSSGGDSEICLLALQLGYDLYYDERLRFTHFILTERLQWPYCVTMISKGFAFPQFYYAMYEYCLKVVTTNENAGFEQLYKWQKRKLLRILWFECNSIKKSFSSLHAMLISKPGNDHEIRLKTAWNKLRHLEKNKYLLAGDFEKILCIVQKAALLNVQSQILLNQAL